MKRYHFRLASVARIRAIQERGARNRLMLDLRDLHYAQEMERSASASLAALDPPAGLISIAEVQWIEDQAERLSDSMRSCQLKVRTAESACMESRRAWNEAIKRASALARLERQEYANWRAEVLREEVAEMDDLSSSRHSSRSRP